MTDGYQLVVIGAGPGGYVAAIKAAQLGMKVAIVERGEVGGTCLNKGCIPTKTLLHSTKLLAELKHSEQIAIVVDQVHVDINKLHQRKNEVIDQLRQGIEGLLKANKITLISGRAVIEGAGKVRIGERVLTTENILIATGAMPFKPAIDGINLPGVVTSDQLLMGQGQQFDQLTIIGGGVIGVEFATIYNALGCKVTIIEAMDRILPSLDREISQNLAMILKKRGINIITSVRVEKIELDEQLVCTFVAKDKEQSISSDGVLVAIGRKANTNGLLAPEVDLPMERGMIVVDQQFETGIKGIYAIGDVIKGGIQLAHVASAQGINAVSAMVEKEPVMDLSVVPSCIYTDPEIATVGITTDEAKAAGIAVKTGKFIMSANGKSLIEMAERGFIKVVADQETDIVLGAQMMCQRASDMISEFSVAIKNQLTLEQVAAVIHPHPTFSEGIVEALEAADGHGIHIAPKGRR